MAVHRSAHVRDLGFIVAGHDFWSEVERVANYELATPGSRVPLPQVIHTGKQYRLLLEFQPDPNRDVLVIRAQLDGEGFRHTTVAVKILPAVDLCSRGTRERRVRPGSI
jgi:hypothetical protein